jgi:hypothetical protein
MSTVFTGRQNGGFSNKLHASSVCLRHGSMKLVAESSILSTWKDRAYTTQNKTDLVLEKSGND